MWLGSGRQKDFTEDFSRWRSAGRPVFPSFFWGIIMLLHHSNGFPIGTGVKITRATPRLRLALMSSLQWYGTGIGVWRVYDLTWNEFDRWTEYGREWGWFIKCTCCRFFEHILLKLWHTFFCWYVWEKFWFTRELTTGVEISVFGSVATVDTDSVGIDSTGKRKLVGSIFTSRHPFWLKYIWSTLLQIYNGCLVLWLLISNCTSSQVVQVQLLVQVVQVRSC